ncbi:MAG: extracellular solute-binding protein [Treponema sp.]|jgi:raffinose/stachyose/melibiose transport system substrate-binding protein|nr:extracellular solute-binding protein [Treponema sp.]
MKMQKPITTMLCILVFAGIFGACGGKQSTALSQAVTTPGLSAPVTLNVIDSYLPNLTEPDVIALNIVIDRFTAAHPDITLVRDQSSADVIDTKVPTLASANELPDIFTNRSAWVPNFEASGQLMPINDLFTDDPAFLTGFSPGMLDDFTYQGKVYGIPWRAMSLFFMYYNMDILAQAGINSVPKTYDELKAAIAAVKKTGVTPIALGDKGKWCSRMWFSGLNVRTAGGDYLERLKSSQLKFTDDVFKKSLGIMKELADMDAFNEDFTAIDFLQARQLYYARKTAMYGEMAAFAQSSETAWPDDIRDVTKFEFFPALPGEGPVSGNVAEPVTADWGLSFNSKLKGDKLVAARVFAKEVLGDAYNQVLAEKGGLAVRPTPLADFSELPSAVVYYNENIAPRIIGGGHIDSRLPGGILETVSAALQETLLGMKQPAEALQDMQNAFDKADIK